MTELKGIAIALALVFVLCSPTVHASKILATVLFPQPNSHAHGVSTVTQALVDGGHDVTILTPSFLGTRGFPEGTYTAALHFRLDSASVNFEAQLETSMKFAFDPSVWSLLHGINGFLDMCFLSCKTLLDDDVTISMLRASEFDVVIGDVFDPCDAILASYLDVPLIALTTSARYPLFHEHIFGVPAPSSYLPFCLLPLSTQMSFRDRVLSYLEHHVLIPTLELVHFRNMDRLKDERGIAPGRGVRELLAKAELWLCMTSFAFDYPRPLAPNWVSIGRVANTPSKPLPKEYNDFVEASGDHGFIVFSLGTYGSTFPDPEIGEHFAWAFSQLPQRVIWRYKGPRLRHLGNNTKVVDWMPQSDLLGHPKARLLIYHGGMHGIYEAVYHAIPMVIMPLFAEQYSNAVNVDHKGIGKTLNKDALSPEGILEVIKEVLENPKYLERARHYSGIHRDSPADPAETVVFWVEHVIKFGASHLRLRSTDLSTIQLHSIDVLAFIAGGALLIALIFISCCRRCVARCRNPKSKTD